MFEKKLNLTTDLNDLTGKVVVITGANTGIGYWTAKHLARKGAKVYIGSRSEEKGTQAIAQLVKEGVSPGEVIYFPCQIGDPASAKKAGEYIVENVPRVDVLINNAGCTYDVTDKPAQDGITEMMMTNHIGTFQFTKVLLPLLIKTSEEPDSDVRILTLSSNFHRYALGSKTTANFKNLDEFRRTYASDFLPPWSRYNASKAANVLFAKALQRKLADTNIISLALHPGPVNTSMSTHTWFPRLSYFILWLVWKTPEVGSYNSCLAAASPIIRQEADKYKGSYLVPVGKIVDSSPLTRNEEMQNDLWDITEKYLAGELV